MSGQRVAVAILSDNRLFRESLGRILARKSEFEVASSRCLPEYCEDALQSQPDVVVLDSVEFLILNANSLKSVRSSSGGPKILLIAMEENEELFLRAVRAGAQGFIPKEASALDVISAVRSVARGDAVCSPRFCKLLFDLIASQSVEMPNSSVRLRLGLTRREQQLVPMIGRGLTNKDIARQLNLSEQTIKNHVHRILHKVGADNRLGILAAVRGRTLSTSTEVRLFQILE